MRTLPPLRRHLRKVAVAAVCVLAHPLAVASDQRSTIARVGHIAPETRVLALPVEFARTTSGFATRRHPIRKTLHRHAGVDFAAAHGTPVRTVDDGIVEFAGTQGGYGKVVRIRHAGNRTTVYAHLSRIDVHVGKRVLHGATIAAVGSTGMSTGPHLHFEVREGGRPIDPLTLAYASPVAPRQQVDVVATLIDPARCFELLQKASLEALDHDEIVFLRGGCVQ